MELLLALFSPYLLTFFAFIYLFLSSININGVEGVPDFQDLDLDMQLKVLNKPYIKSIKIEEGDIYDCVNLHKQPAFDHPLLKNHKIQMKPSFLPKDAKNVSTSSSKSKTVDIGIKLGGGGGGGGGGGCPSGTVPIKRVFKEDLIRANSFMEKTQNYLNSANGGGPSGLHFAGITVGRGSGDGYLGASSTMNIQNPQASNTQYSAAITIFQSDSSSQLDMIKFGWMVNPSLYGDSKTRTFSSWMANGSRGCFDIQCPGFVQISPSTPLTQVLGQISKVGGVQYEMRYIVAKDKKTGNWLLYYGDYKEYVGYWPSSIFGSLSSSTPAIGWGGEAFSSSPDSSPQMGSGYFIEAGYKKAAYMRDLQVVDQSYEMGHIDASLIQYVTDSPDFYNSGPYSESYGFLYGGPGSNA